MSQLKRLLIQQRKKLRSEPNFNSAFRTKLISAGFDQGTLFINGLFFLPLYLKYLGAETYGYWLATGGVLMWLDVFNLATITSQRVAAAYGSKDYKRCACYYWTGLKINGWLAIGIIFIGWGASFIIPAIFNIPKPLDREIVQAFQIAVCSVLVLSFGACAISFVSSIERPRILLLTGPIALALQIIVVLYGLLDGWGVCAIAAGLFAQATFKTLATVVVASWHAWALAGKSHFNNTILMDYLDNLPSSCLRTIGAGVNLRMQPTLITLILGPTIATAYDATSKAILLIQSIMGRIAVSAFSGISNLLSQENRVYAWIKIKKGFFIFQLCALGAITGYVIFNRSFVFLWVGEEYFLGNSITLVIGVGALIAMCVAFFNLILIGSGALKVSGYLAFIRSLTAVGASYWGLSFGGIIGLPLASIANELFYLLVYQKKLSNLGGHFIRVRVSNIHKWIGVIGIIVLSQYLSNMIFIQTWTRFVIFILVLVLLFSLLLTFLKQRNQLT